MMGEDNKVTGVAPMELAIYEEESQSTKLTRKMKESPFFVAGFLGFAGVLTYGFYGIRTRKLPLSVYLIHMRVGAQGFVVSCLTLGICYQMFNEFILPRIKGKDNSPEE